MSEHTVENDAGGDDMTPEEFDRRLDAGEPVELEVRRGNISGATTYLYDWPDPHPRVIPPESSAS